MRSMLSKEKNKKFRRSMKIMLKGAKKFVDGLEYKMKVESDGKLYGDFKLIPTFRNAVAAQYFFQMLSWIDKYDYRNSAKKDLPIITMWQGSDGNLQYIYNINEDPITAVLKLEPVIEAVVEMLRIFKAKKRTEKEKARLSEKRNYRKGKKKK